LIFPHSIYYHEETFLLLVTICCFNADISCRKVRRR
jgi:hypothetical protein